MKELTKAPSWQDAWRAFFEKGDVVGIKVSPVGGVTLSSDASVLRSLIDGLNHAGVSNRNILIFSRYRQEILEAGIDKWLPPGVRFDAPSLKYDDVQLDMGGYDPNHFMEMALLKPGDVPTDAHLRRSYVSKIVTSRVNKIVNLPVLKHHQSAGVTICLKNMSHGFVNNVNRSHLTPTLNACGVFIPSVVRLAGHPRESRPARRRCRESVLSRRSRCQAAVRAGSPRRCCLEPIPWLSTRPV